ncbi:MAG: hypothetical protein JRH11_05495 [Deltaproteobacteria bacterium]|nr:hypothetical protein [Deltaproteobacteria bacterium]
MATSNAIRLPPDPAARARGHVESHFLKAVAPDGQRAIWVKHTLLRPTAPDNAGVAEVWAVAFTRDQGPLAAAKSVFPLTDAHFEHAPFDYRIGPCRLTAETAEGRAASSGHEITWSLGLESLAPEFRPYPLASMYTGPFPKQKALTPVPSARVDGEFTVDGDLWTIDGWQGMQGHNWGEGHSERYAWVHCNAFRGADGRGSSAQDLAKTWLEVMTGRVRVGGVLLPWLTVGALCLDGEMHSFNGARALTSRNVTVTTTRYRTTLRHGLHRLDLDVATTPAAMAGLHYENPDGSMTHCLNSKLAEGTVKLSAPGRPTRTLHSDAFALEIGTKDPDHGIRMRV